MSADHDVLNDLLAAVAPLVDEAAAAVGLEPQARSLTCISTGPPAQVLVGFVGPGGLEAPLMYGPPQPANDAIGSATAELIELACDRSGDAAVIANLVAGGGSFAVYVDAELGRASVRLLVRGQGSFKVGELQGVLSVN